MVRADARGGLPLGPRALAVVACVLAPACLAYPQQRGRALAPAGGPPARQAPHPRAAPSAGGDGEACEEAEDAPLMAPGLVQVGALLRPPGFAPAVRPAAVGAISAGGAEARGGPLARAGSPLAALGVRAGPPAGGERPRAGGAAAGGADGRLSWAGSPLAALGVQAGLALGGGHGRAGGAAAVVLAVGVLVVSLLLLCGCGLARQRGPRPNGAARSLLEQQQAARPPAPIEKPQAGQPCTPAPPPPVQSESLSPLPASAAPPTAVRLPAPAPATAPALVSRSHPAPGDAPILCRSLVVPHLESCFSISMELLLGRRWGTVQIQGGASGRTLLEACVDARQLSLRSLGSDAAPRVTIRNEEGPLAIHGRSGRRFGTLEPAGGPGDCALRLVDGEVGMRLLGEAGPELQFRALAPDGRQVAAGGSTGADWTLQVKPNTDALLITSCILSMIFYAPGDPSEPAPPASARAPAPGLASSRSPPPAAVRPPALGRTSCPGLSGNHGPP